MKTITYNPETHVLVPLEPSQDMIDAMPPVEEIGYWAMYEAAIAAAPQPEPNPNWCVGCSPDNCSGCGAEPVAYTTPQPDRVAELEAETTKLKLDLLTSYGEAEELSGKVAELEAALKVAREAIDALQNGLKWYQDAYPDSISEADHEEIAKVDAAIAKINEVLHD